MVPGESELIATHPRPITQTNNTQIFNPMHSNLIQSKKLCFIDSILVEDEIDKVIVCLFVFQIHSLKFGPFIV